MLVVQRFPYRAAFQPNFEMLFYHSVHGLLCSLFGFVLIRFNVLFILKLNREEAFCSQLLAVS